MVFGASRGASEPWLRTRIPESMVRPRLRGPVAPGHPHPLRRPILRGPHLWELLEKAQLTSVEEGRANRVDHDLCAGKASQRDAIFPRIPGCMTSRPASGAQTANAARKCAGGARPPCPGPAFWAQDRRSRLSAAG